MTSAELVRLLENPDPPVLVRRIREDLGEAIETSARIFGFAPGGEWGGVVRDVEEGRDPIGPFTVGYVTRGMTAVWLLRRGAWTAESGAYRRVGGAVVHGNGTSSWALVPGRRVDLRATCGDWGCEGPVVRHDVLRLMIAVEVLLAGAP